MNGATVYEAKNALGRTCQKLLNKKVQSTFMTLTTVLQAFPSLLPANIELGIYLNNKKKLSNQQTDQQIIQPTQEVLQLRIQE